MSLKKEESFPASLPIPIEVTYSASETDTEVLSSYSSSRFFSCHPVDLDATQVDLDNIAAEFNFFMKEPVKIQKQEQDPEQETEPDEVVNSDDYELQFELDL